jgi:hypothetical protein
MTTARPLASQDLIPSDDEDEDFVPDAREVLSEDEEEERPSKRAKVDEPKPAR